MSYWEVTIFSVASLSLTLRSCRYRVNKRDFNLGTYLPTLPKSRALGTCPQRSPRMLWG